MSIKNPNIKEKFDYNDLFELKKKKPYTGLNLSEISFPLGGIGTGCIGLSGVGGLKDFQIFNRPNVGVKYPRTFPLIRVSEAGKSANRSADKNADVNADKNADKKANKSSNIMPIARVLQAPQTRPYTPLDGGRFHGNGEGFPHMDDCAFYGEFPLAILDFKCKKLPVNVKLEAYNPFIPGDPDNSSIPCAILKYSVENPTNKELDVSILWSLQNLAGYTPEDHKKFLYNGDHRPNGKFLNTYIKSDRVEGIIFSNLSRDENHHLFGSIALTTITKSSEKTSDDSKITVNCSPDWKSGPWFSSHYALWNEFKEKGEITKYDGSIKQNPYPGVLNIKQTIPPRESREFVFYITWYFPNFVKYWDNWSFDQNIESKPRWKNYYANIYEDAFDVAEILARNELELYKKTKEFHDLLFKSTYPDYVLDAISANLAIIKSPTCLRLTDGTLYGFEGCHEDGGCCEGSCTHVWGYQQAFPFLFPSLERSMHEIYYKNNYLFDDCGALIFRTQLPPGIQGGLSYACADGQFGTIIHLYREWKISGNSEWIKKMWPDLVRSLEFAFEEWDEDKTGVLRSFQHCTYDIDLEGPNPMLTCYYLSALKAASEIAEYLGNKEKKEFYLEIFNKGRKWVDENLFNGEYYIQIYNPEVAKTFQIGPGCLIDQLVGLQIGRIAGISNYLKEEHIKSALKSIFKYNWKPDMREHENGARLYAVNDEAATLICSWPKGGRPEIPFPYADEVMNGFEYQFGVHCIMENLIEEGLAVIRSIRDRYDGWGRNPWDEFECGHYYARSMASYGVLNALLGFEFNLAEKYLGFAPKRVFGLTPGHNKGFKSFWILGDKWGEYNESPGNYSIKIHSGKILLKSVKVGNILDDFKKLNRPIKENIPVVLTIRKNEEDLVLNSECSIGGMIELNSAIELKADDSIQIVFMD